MLPPNVASAEAAGVFTARLERWRRADHYVNSDSSCVVGAVESNSNAWLAALDDGRVICSVDGCCSDSVSSALRVMDALEAPERLPGEDETRAAFTSLRRWLDAEELVVTCGLGAPVGPTLRSVFRWLDAVARTVPRHEQATLLPLVTRIRDSLRTPLPLGAERQLGAVALGWRRTEADAPGALMSARAIVDSAARNRVPARSQRACIVALILAGPLRHDLP